MNEDSKDKLVGELIQVFDDVLQEDGWDSSFLLQVAQKRLLKAREKLDKVRRESSVKSGARHDALPEDQMLVYVSLYQALGGNLNIWEQMLKVLASCSLGRPIYASEDIVRQAIESRPDLMKEAYVEVMIPKSGILILQDDKALKDVNGNDLLSLHPGVVNPLGVKRFVHANNLEYKFVNGKLLLS